ncbi:MAG TPA: hypothetical protein EYQ50_10730 [Verrucomicrobiales bacterium]|jgi:hypothetical protein|nr:hypothetical protein [Verrucomicrobiales bacterium]
MSLLRFNKQPTSRELKGFGFFWMLFFGMITALRFRKAGGESTSFWVLLGLTVSVPVIGWCFPVFMRWVYLGLNFAVYPIGRVVSVVLLAVIFYGVVTPTGWMMRFFKYDPMSRRFEPDRESYFEAREENIEPKRYFKQY